MSKTFVAAIATLATVVVLGVCALLWQMEFKAEPDPGPKAGISASSDGANSPSREVRSPTLLYAHNLLLRKGPTFRVYIRWIRGEMLRTHRDTHPSFDDPDSFVLQIQKGVIHVNIGDIADYLNNSSPPNAALRNISIQPDGVQLKIRGTAHKAFSFPIEMSGKLSSTPDGYVRFHVSKLDVLKIPMKGLLGSLHLKLSDLVPSTDVPGIQIAENDILFDTQKVLPPPHIFGPITSVTVSVPDLEVIYGNAPNDEARLAQWHNFLRLSGGTLDFGKLTMHNVDLTMIDASNDPWFDLDLVNYQAQLVNGYTRMTAQAGLEVYMPDVDDKAPKTAGNSITMEWLKDRNRSLPIDLPSK